MRDLTERSRLQAELVQAQKMEAIGMLVAGVAHELNNPLASIVAFSQLLRTDPGLPVDLRRQADLLIQEVEPDEGDRPEPPRLRPAAAARAGRSELRPLVDSVLGLQSYIFSRNRLEVEIDIPRDLPRLAIDRSQIQQVLINLTVNAAQAIQETGRPGRIRVEARSAATAAGPTVRISIKDDGPGVADAMRDRLFVPFVDDEGAGPGHRPRAVGVVRHRRRPRRHPALRPEPRRRVDLHRSSCRSGGRRPRRPPASPPVASRPAPPPGATRPALDDGTAPGRDRQPGRRRPARGHRGTARGRAPARPRPRRRAVDPRVPESRPRPARLRARPREDGSGGDRDRPADPPAAILCDHRMAGMNGTEFHAAVSAIDPVLGRRFAFMSGDVLNPELHDFADGPRVQLLAKPFDIATVGTLVGRLLGDEA